MSLRPNQNPIPSLLKRNPAAIARVISMIENHEPGVFDILAKLFPKTGRALRVGITGFPGAGKSTLINQLTQALLRKSKKVGIVLMDPTSPFSGGALLGDRIRMRDIQMHPNVFIRSMATRGKMGGLNLASRYASDVLDAAGFDFIFLETVGVGQLEIDIATSSDVTMVVMTPDSGDEVQAMKAGLMEIADIFVVNKMDRDKEEIYFNRIKQGLAWHSEARGRTPAEVIPTAAILGRGLERLVESLLRFRKKKRSGSLNHGRDKIRAEEDVKSCVEEMIMDRLLAQPKVEAAIKNIAVSVRRRKKSPYEAANQIIKLGFGKI